MKLLLVTGQTETEKIIVEKYQFSDYQKIYSFPEKEFMHPKKLFDKLEKDFRDNITNEVSFLVYTFSEVVYNALMVAVHRTHYEDGKCIQVRNDGTFKETEIHKMGKLNWYEDEIFDVFENAMDIILDISN